MSQQTHTQTGTQVPISEIAKLFGDLDVQFPNGAVIEFNAIIHKGSRQPEMVYTCGVVENNRLQPYSNLREAWQVAEEQETNRR